MIGQALAQALQEERDKKKKKLKMGRKPYPHASKSAPGIIITRLLARHNLRLAKAFCHIVAHLINWFLLNIKHRTTLPYNVKKNTHPLY